MRIYRIVLIFALFSLFTSLSARASTVLYSTDGSSTPSFFAGSGSTSSGPLSFAMQFTPTITGILSSITLPVSGSATSDKVFITTNGSTGPGATLDTISITVSSTNTEQSGNSVNNPLLTSGTLYWIEVTAPTSGNVTWRLASPITAGKTWNSSGGSSSGNLDAFTILETTTVPEPGTVVPFLFGSLCLLVGRKLCDMLA